MKNGYHFIEKSIGSFEFGPKCSSNRNIDEEKLQTQNLRPWRKTINLLKTKF